MLINRWNGTLLIRAGSIDSAPQLWGVLRPALNLSKLMSADYSHDLWCFLALIVRTLNLNIRMSLCLNSMGLLGLNEVAINASRALIFTAQKIKERYQLFRIRLNRAVGTFSFGLFYLVNICKWFIGGTSSCYSFTLWNPISNKMYNY